MQIIIKGRHVDLTPALKLYAEEKIGLAVRRLFDHPAGKIVIELSCLAHKATYASKECRVTVFMPGGRIIVIAEVDEDFYKAINIAHDRLLLQVSKVCDKDYKRKRRVSLRDAYTNPSMGIQSTHHAPIRLSY